MTTAVDDLLDYASDQHKDAVDARLERDMLRLALIEALPLIDSNDSFTKECYVLLATTGDAET